MDESKGPELPATGQETSLGGASEWSTVQPPAQPPAAPIAPVVQPPSNGAANPYGQPAGGFLEPLPQPVVPGPVSAAPAGPPMPQPPAPPAPSAGYQPVYGSTGQQQPPPSPYASGPQSYPPPPPGGPGMPPPPGQGYGAPGGPGYPPPGAPPAGQGLSSNAAAAISYLTFIPAVIFLVMAPYNRDRFVRFHAWQCIALTIVWVVISIVFMILTLVGFHFMWWMMTLIHMLVRLVLFVFWLIALIKANQGQWFRIPIVGDLAQSFAGKEA